MKTHHLYLKFIKTGISFYSTHFLKDCTPTQDLEWEVQT